MVIFIFAYFNSFEVWNAIFFCFLKKSFGLKSFKCCHLAFVLSFLQWGFFFLFQRGIVEHKETKARLQRFLLGNWELKLQRKPLFHTYAFASSLP